MEGVFLSPDMFEPDSRLTVFFFDTQIGSIQQINDDYISFPLHGKQQTFSNQDAAITYIKLVYDRSQVKVVKTANPLQASLF